MASSSSLTERALTRRASRQRRFVEEFLIDFNAVKAAHRAGYSEKDVTAGHRLIRNAEVQAEIQRRCLEAQVRLEVTADHIKQGFARIGFDPRQAKNGGPTHTERIAALRELGRLLGLYIEKHVFTGATLEQLLALADEREKSLPPDMPAIEGNGAYPS